MHYKYENIKHIEGLPLRVFCVSLGERIFHWHKELELIFVLRGSVDITLDNEVHTIREEDVFLINPYDVHGFTNASDDNILLALQVDLRYARNYYKGIDKIRFNAKYLTDSNIIDILRYFLANILVALKANYDNKNLLVMGMMNFIISYLVNDFSIIENETTQSKLKDSDRQRIIRVINYVNENYNKKVSLQELADSEHLSKYYLSHFVKERLSMSFQDLVNQIRLEKATALLSKTNLSILDITIECGFSDTKYLNKLLKEKYHCSAKEYRKQQANINKTIRFDLTDENYQHMPFDFLEALKRLEKYAKKMWTREDIISVSTKNQTNN